MTDSELPFVEVQLSSYEVKSGNVPVSVRGRLRKSVQFWREIDAPRFIVDTIEFGYKLPLLQIPPPFDATNNNSALQESEFVESAISELLSLECITEVFAPPAVINPLSVSIQKSGKKRLILDLRHVNQYLFKSKFRCEDVSIAREVLNPGDFMFSFDLKSGYHHVEIFPEHRQYLSFSWIFSSGFTRYFQFSVLPFGLSSTPYLFTKLLKPLVKKWRTEGKSIVVFLDDGLGAAADYTNARISSLSVHADLLSLALSLMKRNLFGSQLKLSPGLVLLSAPLGVSYLKPMQEFRPCRKIYHFFWIQHTPHCAKYASSLVSAVKLFRLGTVSGT